MSLTLATTARSSMAVALNGLITPGSKIEIRDGTRPAGPGTTATGTLLATIVLKNPAFTEGSNGVLTIADPDAVTGVATGTATWFRLLTSANVAILDGKVTNNAGTGDLKLATTSITTGLTVDVSAGGQITMPAGTAD
jgi:hypothetical protein